MRRTVGGTLLFACFLASAAAVADPAEIPDAGTDAGCRAVGTADNADTARKLLENVEARASEADWDDPRNTEDAAKELSLVRSGELAIRVLPCCYASLTPTGRRAAELLIARLRPRLEDWKTKLTTEATCRASDGCIGEWVCLAIDDKRQAQKDMARERSNPSGVVDLRVLHELGERIQSDDQEIARRKGWFQQWRQKPFTERICH
jgi:hypothetical protein